MDSNPILHSFQLLLLEHIAMCRLVMGNKTLAIQEVGGKGTPQEGAGLQGWTVGPAHAFTGNSPEQAQKVPAAFEKCA